MINALPFPDEKLPALVDDSSIPNLIEASRKRCPSCGCRSALQPHRMDARKVELLEILARAARGAKLTDWWCYVGAGRSVDQPSSGLAFLGPYRGDQHAARLVWFGLAERHSDKRSGLYRITAHGLDFLRGLARVPARILCRDGEVLYASKERVDLSGVRNVSLDKAYWDGYPFTETVRRASS